MKQSYSKYYLIFISLLFFSISVSAQKSENLWTKTSKENVLASKQILRNSQPTKVKFYKLDINSFKRVLQNAPKRNEFTGVSNVIISFPTENGNFETFRIKEASNMTLELQAKFPEIRSYIGQGIDNPSAIIRFSISPEKGLSSMVLSNKKTVFIEPYTNDLSTYIVFINSSTDKNNSSFICETEYLKNEIDFNTVSARNANDGQLRTFRLALACTGEYATFHGGTQAGALAAMNTTMTRVNGVFERDVALTMVMVDNTSIIFLDGTTDPYTNDNGSAMLSENQTTCDTNIGTANYDIGHVFSTGGGGVAYLNSQCNSSTKAGGVTGQGSPVGDTFDIDYVAHEFGHQYGANHTQNNSCQRSAVSVEPGSASTIMGYAGICAPNVQNNSDDYFHGENIKEMWANISAGASQCATQSATGNNAPIAIAGANYTIPKSTPFVLKGDATDVDVGNILTYCWEQVDTTPATMPPVSTSTAGPAFRSLQPKTSPNRYMPDFATVLGGATASTWEVVPSVGRTMSFSLTVRDNVSGGASTASDNMIVTVEDSSGPFSVISQTTNETWEVGSNQTVTWDVANTNIAPVNTANINVLLSIDGGLTFPFTIAANVPNNGSTIVTIPSSTTTTQARVIVEAIDNIFYAVNSTDFTIIEVDFIISASNPLINICQPDDAVYNFTYNTFSGFSETTVFSANNVPTGATVTFNPTSASADETAVTMTVSNTVSVATGNHTITAVGTAPSSTYNTDVTLNIFSSTINATTLNTPLDNAIDVSAMVTLNWTADVNSEDYLVEIATDSGFTNIVDSATIQTISFTNTMLGASTQYFWRVTASNQCGTATPSSVFNFTTENIICNNFNATDTPLDIPDNNTTGIISIINVPGVNSVNINDVFVSINITHTWVGDLTLTLISPSGTNIVLSATNGGSGDNYINTVFDDDAINAIGSGVAPFTGSFSPDEALRILNGEFSSGDWSLVVVDGAGQDTGSIDSWSLEICGSPPTDSDGDGFNDDIDNCPAVANANQADFDNDGLGDVCDSDIDNDGILNANDLCDDTPLGDSIGVDGCTVFTLPVTNFSLLINSETCRNSNNGNITITAVEVFNYTAQLTGNGIDTSNAFTTSTIFSGLEAGNYMVCITVENQTVYEQCFNIVITEPEDLSVTSRVDTSTSRLNLELSGGINYTIDLNGIITNTTDTEISLTLSLGINRLIVKTDQDCQGIHRETINNSLQMIIYPNPVVNENVLNIFSGNTSIEKIDIIIYSILGKTLLTQTISLNQGKASIDISSISTGIYLLVVNTSKEQSTFKVIKK